MVPTLTSLFRVAVCCLLFASAASGSTVSLDALWRGTYYSPGIGFYPDIHSNMFRDFITGQADGKEYRSYFVFDLRSITQKPIVSASITFSLLGSNVSCEPGPTCGFSSSDASETFAMFDYDQPLNVWDGPLRDLVTAWAGVSGFNDLGSGALFGNVTVAPYQETATLELNSQALVALNANEGQLFAMGGALTTIDGSENQFLFGGSRQDSSLLTLAFASSEVPEPTSLLLLGSGVLACAYRMRAKSVIRVNRG